MPIMYGELYNTLGSGMLNCISVTGLIQDIKTPDLFSYI